MRLYLLLLCTLLCITVYAQPRIDTDSVISAAKKHVSVWRKIAEIDTSYIEPQKFNYTVMLQSTCGYNFYRMGYNGKYSVSFAPRPSFKIGPYIGWRWVFLGYALDVNYLNAGKDKQDFNVSLYSNMLGIDLFYKKLDGNFLVKSLHYNDKSYTHTLKNMEFDGLNTSVKGFNLYYILNHKHFSYPAAFSQSTIQRRSCGSILLGLEYTNQSLNINWNRLKDLAAKRVPDAGNVDVDSVVTFGSLSYSDYGMSIGYAYNWVLAKNLLLDASLSAVLAYKHTKGENEHKAYSLPEFMFSNFNVNGLGRLGFVWNTMRWYAGTSLVVHAYNYYKDHSYTTNLFGNVNVYMGYNFGRIFKQKRKKDK